MNRSNKPPPMPYGHGTPSPKLFRHGKSPLSWGFGTLAMVCSAPASIVPPVRPWRQLRVFPVDIMLRLFSPAPNMGKTHITERPAAFSGYRLSFEPEIDRRLNRQVVVQSCTASTLLRRRSAPAWRSQESSHRTFWWNHQRQQLPTIWVVSSERSRTVTLGHATLAQGFGNPVDWHTQILGMVASATQIPGSTFQHLGVLRGFCVALSDVA